MPTTVWANTGNSGYGLAGQIYVTGGTTVGSLVGVTQVSDACSRHDAVDAHLLSLDERVAKGIQGGLQLVGTSYSAAIPAGLLRFGTIANQTSHTFRHVVAAGLDQGAVQSAVEADIAANLNAITAGLNVRTIIVSGQQLTYNAFKLPSGVINVGRITLP